MPHKCPMLFLTRGYSTRASDSGSCDPIPLASVVGVRDHVRLLLGMTTTCVLMGAVVVPQPAGCSCEGQHGLVLADHERLLVAGAVGIEPPALQLPAGAHDTDPIWAPPALNAAVPATFFAARQTPLTSLTTNAPPGEPA